MFPVFVQGIGFTVRGLGFGIQSFGSVAPHTP